MAPHVPPAGDRHPALRVRDEETRDRERVLAVQQAAFGRPDEARLADRLRAEVRPHLSLVAEADGRVVGHVLFTPVHVAGGGAEAAAAGLAPLAVEPAHQRRGLGAALVREGLGRCPQLGWQAVFVLGDPAYYGRFGFVPAAPLGLRYEDGGFEAAFQVLELVPGALAGCRGAVRYAEPFRGGGTA